jgi:phosphoribosyl 1,2-cyclic phosphodiesterase
MKIKFWGVRGSIPTPITSQQIKSRIAAVVQRIKPDDLANATTRELFLSRLPPYLFGTIGGNTTCVEIKPDDGSLIICDAGSGIRSLGYDIQKRKVSNRNIHILLTHFHWDHLQGFPFFIPAFLKDNTIYFHHPEKDFECYLKEQMKPPFFPITMDMMAAQKIFHVIKEEAFFIGQTKIFWKKMKHPGDSYAFKLVSGDKAVIFATDAEITDKEFGTTEENSAFFDQADVLILDSQYTLGESIDKIDWGHTAYSMAVDFAVQWRIKKLILFHYEPQYADKKVLTILRSAQWYLQHQENKKLDIMLAIEGMEVNV